jgi:murein DD-endopeptidase MepM/ murein hydrolase activator NlpD
MSTLYHPVPGARITQEFGANPEYYARFNLPGHEGVDFSAIEGTPVYAALTGIASVHKGQNYGLFVEIQSEDKNERVRTAHMSAAVTAGSVYAGELVGYSGNTGNSEAPHVHFMYWRRDDVGNDYYGWVNPLLYIGDGSDPIYRQREDILRRAHEIVVPMNLEAALIREGIGLGMLPASDEDYSLGYPLQAFRRLENKESLYVGVWKDGVVTWFSD